MRHSYPLFQSHLDLAHHYWSQLIKPGDLVIDATCGNGKDALKLAELALDPVQGALYVCDLQSQALQTTHQYLTTHLAPPIVDRISFIQGCHSRFPSEIKPETVKLIVYNLGYLPGGDKNLTTCTETTLQSLHASQALVMPGGIISITCYPGHFEGAVEEEALIKYTQTLSPKHWNVCYHRWLNRSQSPSFLLLQKVRT